jgi:hypothetical protein
MIFPFGCWVKRMVRACVGRMLLFSAVNLPFVALGALLLGR